MGISPTADIDARSEREDLETRIERALQREIQNRLGPDADCESFADADERGSGDSQTDWILVRADRVIEEPLGTGIFRHQIQIIGRGMRSQVNDEIGTMLATTEVISCLVADAAAENDSGFVVPRGQCAQLDGATNRGGVGNDLENRWMFSIWAQAKEISDAA